MQGPASILLIDDQDDEALLVRRAIADTGYTGELSAVQSVMSARKYLESDAGPFIKLVLLDLKFPGPSGFDFLKWRGESSFSNRIPTVVLSNSDSQTDICQAYDLGANSYLNKPVSFTEFKDLIAAAISYWIDVNELPNDNGFGEL
ncbi:response regulator [Stratiformator vulcanicus]|uniref:Response regulator rcp1 n=1 Tax=Stratiformator vulcanicus TaxID=2527980 RepID=A0A517QWS7_9PLAN|nr:response regulator [Stratiformator vulcanicus]QDT36122.1 Response regulator rcp1 [Stratiformator vulcanicus]